MKMTSFARIGSMKRYTMLPTTFSLYVVVIGAQLLIACGGELTAPVDEPDVSDVRWVAISIGSGAFFDYTCGLNGVAMSWETLGSRSPFRVASRFGRSPLAGDTRVVSRGTGLRTAGELVAFRN